MRIITMIFLLLWVVIMLMQVVHIQLLVVDLQQLGEFTEHLHTLLATLLLMEMLNMNFLLQEQTLLMQHQQY